MDNQLLSNEIPAADAVNRPIGEAGTNSKISIQTTIVLILIAFLSSTGITIVFPVLPFMVSKYTGNPDELASIVGWLTSVYAIGQFVAAPALGILSDRFGRRPILLICLVGSALGYLFLGIGGALWVLFLGRILDGLTGGDFSVLTAYVADVTRPEERGKFFGRFGAAVGVGFIVGPVIGGAAAQINIEAPFFLSAGVIGLIILMAIFYLPESLPKTQRAARLKLSELNPLKQLKDLLYISDLRSLLGLGVLYHLGNNILAVTFGVLAIDSLQADAGSISLLFLLIGAIDIVVQGGLIGKLLPIFGERKLLIAGFILQIAAYGMLATLVFVASPILLVAGVVLYAVSSGLVEPSLNSLLSSAVNPEKQGVVQGSNTALTSLVAIIAPIVGGLLYTQMGHASPYLLAAGAMLLATSIAWLAVPKLNAPAASEVTQPG